MYVCVCEVILPEMPSLTIKANKIPQSVVYVHVHIYKCIDSGNKQNKEPPELKVQFTKKIKLVICRSKPIREMFIFETQIKIFLKKLEIFVPESPF